MREGSLRSCFYILHCQKHSPANGSVTRIRREEGEGLRLPLRIHICRLCQLKDALAQLRANEKGSQ